MQHFTGIEYIKIDIANNWGLDKATWDVRLDWVKENYSQLENMDTGADEPVLFRKAVRALRDAENGIPTGYAMSLDCTSSGLMIMSALIGDEIGAKNTNIISTGKREDIYVKVANEMNKSPLVQIDRATIKKPVMTHYYGSKMKPKEIFGENTPELAAFYNILQQELPGPVEVLQDIQSCWQKNVLTHEWKLPDGHIVISKVVEPVDKKVEIQELDKKSFTHRIYINKPAKYGLSLAANIVHSIDAYIVREMIRRSDFELYTIHDSFWTSPNNMNQVRETFLEILIEIAKSDLLEDILGQVTNDKSLKLTGYKDISNKMKTAEYFLS